MYQTWHAICWSVIVAIPRNIQIFAEGSQIRSSEMQLCSFQCFLFSLGVGIHLIHRPGPEVIKLCSYSTQLSTKFILLINVKMPTIVGILTFISMTSTASERPKARHFFICRYFSFYELLKFRAQLR